MDRKLFRGVGPAVVTPMHADGSVDLDGYAEHLEFLIGGGVHFLVPCGTTGESATLSADEQLRVLEKTVEVAAGRTPILAGAGTNDTREACERARAAVRAGADAVLSVTPYYNKPTQEGLYRHFMSVAEAADAPVFVYTVPGRTACNVLPETLFRLAEGHPMIAGVKEASGDMGQVMAILRDRPEGFLVLSGEDHLTFPMIAMGGDGVISVVANEVPARFSEMVEAALAADYPRALEIHFHLLQLMQANFYETNPIPVKTALEIMGHHDAHFRLPLCEMSEKNRERLRQALEQAGVETRRSAGSVEHGSGAGERVAAARAGV
jgi:4-hydroxy-tetrahydrodipicolinate synthase